MHTLLKTVTLPFLLASLALASEPADRALAAQNPMAAIMKLSVENRFNQGIGYKNQTGYGLNLKPSMPSDLSEDWLLINRLDVPFLYQPGLVPGDKDSFGMGDVTYEGFYGPSGDRTVYWGAGPAFRIPTATDHALGSRKWSAGLAGTTAIVKGPVVAGIRASQLWSFAGKSDRPDVNLMTFEYFAYLNLGDGWWIGTSPINTANWDVPQSEVWTLPVGGGIGKLILRGRLPINVKLEAYHYAEAPTGTADWSALFSIQFLLPDDLFFWQRP